MRPSHLNAGRRCVSGCWLPWWSSGVAVGRTTFSSSPATPRAAPRCTGCNARPACHGASGLGEDDTAFPNLKGNNLTEAAATNPEESDPDYIDNILKGKGEMTPQGAFLTDQQIADVLAYMHDGLFE